MFVLQHLTCYLCNFLITCSIFFLNYDNYFVNLRFQCLRAFDAIQVMIRPRRMILHTHILLNFFFYYQIRIRDLHRLLQSLSFFLKRRVERFDNFLVQNFTRIFAVDEINVIPISDGCEFLYIWQQAREMFSTLERLKW